MNAHTKVEANATGKPAPKFIMIETGGIPAWRRQDTILSVSTGLRLSARFDAPIKEVMAIDAVVADYVNALPSFKKGSQIYRDILDMHPEIKALMRESSQ